MNSLPNSIQKEILNYLEYDDLKKLASQFLDWKDYIVSLKLLIQESVYEFVNTIHLDILPSTRCEISEFINLPKLKTVMYEKRLFHMDIQEEKDEFVSLYSKHRDMILFIQQNII